MTKSLIIRNRRIRVFVQTLAYLHTRTSRLHNCRELIRAAGFETESWEETAANVHPRSILFSGYRYAGVNHAMRVIRECEKIYFSFRISIASLSSNFHSKRIREWWRSHLCVPEDFFVSSAGKRF